MPNYGRSNLANITTRIIPAIFLIKIPKLYKKHIVGFPWTIKLKKEW